MKAVYLEGYKSFFSKQRVKLAPVTIFAGANSSGKSSVMQPLLLMKQTIESQYDPGTLLLSGANIKFTSLEQMLSKRAGEDQKTHFTVGIESKNNWFLEVTYCRKDEYGIGVKNVTLRRSNGFAIQFWEGKKFAENEAVALTEASPIATAMQEQFRQQNLPIELGWYAVAARCFPDIGFGFIRGAAEHISEIERVPILSELRKKIVEIIHIQGLRGNPERTYPSTARISKKFPGVFTDYVASALQRWQEDHDKKLELLGGDLRKLGLSWKVETKAVHDTQVEIRVSRLPGPTRGGARDVVNLADVGLGVSQVLPLLVALRVAKKGQIVFVEQPEIHLHPKAQYDLADIILEAAERGVYVWLETHSSSLLRAFQTKVAQGVLDPENLALNWFSRDTMTGSTVVSTADVTPLGQYGKWPVDFDDVSLNIEKQFAATVAKKVFDK
jgi:predicted ATPase